MVFKVTKWLASSVCIFYVSKVKSNNLRNEKGYIDTKRESERILIYPWLFVHNVDLRVLLGSSLQKVSSVEGKSHNHLKHTEGLFHLGGKNETI